MAAGAVGKGQPFADRRAGLIWVAAGDLTGAQSRDPRPQQDHYRGDQWGRDQSGLSLALACDFRVAARTARLGSATLRFGYLPDEGGHHLLVRHIGVAKTLDFLMRKRIVDAAQALEWAWSTKSWSPKN